MLELQNKQPIKNRCPYLRCFFCHKMGHLKKNCHLKMLEYVYNKIREDSARKEMTMIKNKEKREEKKQQKELKKNNRKESQRIKL